MVYRYPKHPLTIGTKGAFFLVESSSMLHRSISSHSCADFVTMYHRGIAKELLQFLMVIYLFLSSGHPRSQRNEQTPPD